LRLYIEFPIQYSSDVLGALASALGETNDIYTCN